MRDVSTGMYNARFLSETEQRSPCREQTKVRVATLSKRPFQVTSASYGRGREIHTYIERNQTFLPNYGGRYRNGERIASGFVESRVNQVLSKRMVKRQQMQWTQRGAHLLLQIRPRLLNEEWEGTFRRWHPDFSPQTPSQPVKKAACPPEFYALVSL
jgi:hypothetical protein